MNKMDNNTDVDEENNPSNVDQHPHPPIKEAETETSIFASSIFPVDFTENNVFTSHLDNGVGSSGTDAAKFQPGRDDFMPFSDSDTDSEAVEVAWVDSMGKSDPSSSDDDDDDESKSTAEEGTKRSILHSRGCTFVMAALIIGSIAFIVSIFALYPRSREVDAAEDIGYTDSRTSNNDETIGRQFPTKNEVEATSPIVINGTISPSPTSFPTLYPTAIPSQYHSSSPHPTSQIESIVLVAVADTFISEGEMQEQTFGKEVYLEVGGRGTNSSISISVIRFDTSPLIELNATVVSTQMRLFSRSTSAFGGQINLASDDCDWNENSTSWQNAPRCLIEPPGTNTTGLDEETSVLGRFGEVLLQNEWYEADLAWQPSEIPSQLTLVISSDLENALTYFSHDANDDSGSRAPVLMVEYLTHDSTGT